MVATFDDTQLYSSAISYQRENFERSSKRLDRNFSFSKFIARKLIPGLLKKFNKLLISQLLATKGAISELSGKRDKIEGQDFAKQINELEDFLLSIINLKDKVDLLIGLEEDKEYPDLSVTQTLLAELIDNLYSVQRIFKKHTLEKPKETSELARELSRTSVKSLEKALYGN